MFSWARWLLTLVFVSLLYERLKLQQTALRNLARQAILWLSAEGGEKVFICAEIPWRGLSKREEELIYLCNNSQKINSGCKMISLTNWSLFTFSGLMLVAWCSTRGHLPPRGLALRQVFEITAKAIWTGEVSTARHDFVILLKWCQANF